MPPNNIPYLSRSYSASPSASAASAIKDHILHENLKPGDPLPTEVQLREKLGVSRTAVREAIRQLSALHIVQVRHGYGMFVGDVSLQPLVESLVFRGLLNPGDDARALREIVEVRKALDIAFAPAIVSSWRGKDSPELLSAVTTMEELAAIHKSFPKQDRFFHSELLAPLGNQLFRQLTEAFWDVHMLISPRMGVPTAEDIDVTANAHRQMYQAAVDGDVRAYESAVVRHYEPLLRTLEIYTTNHSKTQGIDETPQTDCAK
ncbi:GntR family transcriptional regulator [Propionimicrobium lymphophilum]|uniref:FadR/GntR family transcriptional regulator n=1 Tax=Propionimicrobium lymphophilum TaxID=33012 RepID=UPI00254A9586|nr:GntR family transcriptional regulator [Propionimicrobium lymphophilum]MDK7709153.1 GntR family transcriptional regulator [Propionimicrobium lymphophilum]MDK7732900.1 GntR family transcriptional regulator [Propionimicrobium lymphophilum]